MTYSEKLRDPRWQKKRLYILDRDNFSCQYCGETEKTIHVHHMGVDDSALISLCEDCHKVEHLKNMSSMENELKDAIQFAALVASGKDLFINNLVKTMNSILLRHG